MKTSVTNPTMEEFQSALLTHSVNVHLLVENHNKGTITSGYFHEDLQVITEEFLNDWYEPAKAPPPYEGIFDILVMNFLRGLFIILGLASGVALLVYLITL